MQSKRTDTGLQSCLLITSWELKLLHPREGEVADSMWLAHLSPVPQQPEILPLKT